MSTDFALQKAMHARAVIADLAKLGDGYAEFCAELSDLIDTTTRLYIERNEARSEVQRLLGEVAKADADLAGTRAALAEQRNAKDAAYRERNQVVAALARAALLLGWKVGLRKTDLEGWDPDWHNCVWIELPTGQASWHFRDSERDLFRGLPGYDAAWDGHTTPQKYDRLAGLASLVDEVSRG
jgi:hypothetical protein